MPRHKTRASNGQFAKQPPRAKRPHYRAAQADPQPIGHGRALAIWGLVLLLLGSAGGYTLRLSQAPLAHASDAEGAKLLEWPLKPLKCR